MTILTKQSEIAEASTADLIATYNAYSGKPPIARFSSRAAGESQTANAILRGQDTAAHAGVPKGAKAIEPRSEAAIGAKIKERLAARSEQAAVGSPAPKTDRSAAAPFRKPAKPSNGVTHACSELTKPKRAETETLEGFEKARPSRDASEGQRTSWLDSEVRASRSLKQRVSVDGTNYRSVAAAFVALGLPMTEHVRFRMELKAAGRAVHTFNGVKRVFKIVEAAA